MDKTNKERAMVIPSHTGIYVLLKYNKKKKGRNKKNKETRKKEEKKHENL